MSLCVCVDIVVSEIRCWQVSWLLLFWFFFFCFFGQFLFSRYSRARCCCCCCRHRRNPKWKISKQERETNLISSSTIYFFGGLSVLYPARVSLSLFSFHISFIEQRATAIYHEKQLTLCIALTLWHAESSRSWLLLVELMGGETNYHGNRGERCRREPFFDVNHFCFCFLFFFSDLFSLFLSHTLIDLYFVVF